MQYHGTIDRTEEAVDPEEIEDAAQDELDYEHERNDRPKGRVMQR